MEKKVYEMHDKFEEAFWYIEVRKDLINELLNSLDLEKNSTLADFGCGPGRHYEVLSKYGNVLCVDNNKEALEACKKRGIKETLLADVTKTGIKSESLDVICAMDLMEHLEDDLKFLKDARRILKKDGIMILTTPAFEFLWSIDDELAHHKRRYTKNMLEKLAKKAGFKVELISYRYFYIFLPSLLIFQLQKLKSKKKNSLKMTPPFANKLLVKIMRHENKKIAGGKGYPFGVGLIALLRKG